MAYIDQSTLAADPEFIARVRQAAVTSAINIMADIPTVETQAVHIQRANLARNVLHDPTFWGSTMAIGVASNVAITPESTDMDIQFTINSEWNAYAGVINEPV